MAGCPAQPTWFAAAREEAQLLQAEILRLQVLRAPHGIAGCCPGCLLVAAQALTWFLTLAMRSVLLSQRCRSRQISSRGWLTANSQQWRGTQAVNYWEAAAAATAVRASRPLSCLSVYCQVWRAIWKLGELRRQQAFVGAFMLAEWLPTSSTNSACVAPRSVRHTGAPGGRARNLEGCSVGRGGRRSCRLHVVLAFWGQQAAHPLRDSCLECTNEGTMDGRTTPRLQLSSVNTNHVP